MRTNPGGEIAPADVVGRDALIERLWSVLGRQSVLLTAERRMGKSCLIKKMKAESPEGTIAVYRDVEGLETPLRFVERVYEDVAHYLSKRRRTADGVQTLLRHICGLEVPGFRLPMVAAPHWKDLLERTLSDLATHQDSTVIFFWDEIPMMLEKIRRASGERLAVEMLDTLRALRQTFDGVRMVYTGSIGLHHVTTSIRESGHASNAINDLRVVEVPPLAESSAAHLARQLLVGESCDVSDLDEVTVELARQLDGVPYYIHHAVCTLAEAQRPVTPDVVRDVVRQALTDAADPWHLRHFRDRLRDYYSSDDRPLAEFILDDLASSETALTVDDLRLRLTSVIRPDDGPKAARIADGDTAPLRALIDLLERDHYVTRGGDDTVAFRFPLIRRWWRHSRGLVA